jgi:hypothetical protein
VYVMDREEEMDHSGDGERSKASALLDSPAAGSTQL